jgi:hypothetical protein
MRLCEYDKVVRMLPIVARQGVPVTSSLAERGPHTREYPTIATLEGETLVLGHVAALDALELPYRERQSRRDQDEDRQSASQNESVHRLPPLTADDEVHTHAENRWDPHCDKESGLLVRISYRAEPQRDGEQER